MKQWITAKLFPVSLPSLLLALIISAFATGSLYLHLFLMQPIGRRRLAFLMLIITSLLLGTYLVIRLLILPVCGRLRKEHLALALSGSLMSGLYLFTFSPWQIPTLYLSFNQLEISVEDEKNPLSGGTAVELLGFSAERQFISFSDFSIEGDWQRISDRMVASGTQAAQLRWQGIAREIVLIFKTSPESGIVRVLYDGKEQAYDLYSPHSGQLYVHEKSPVSLPGTRLPAIISSIIPLAFLTLCGLCVMMLAWPNFQVTTQKSGKFIRQKNRHLPLIFSLLGGILFFVVSHRFGLWIAGDSVNYISAARHLIKGDGYIALNSDVFDWWPPFYPALLSPFQLFSPAESLIGIRWMHACLLIAIIYCSGLLLQNLLSNASKRYYAAILLLITVGSPLTEAAVYLLSEPLFILLELLFFLWVVRFLETGQTKYALLFTLAAALHALTRYPGMVLIFTGCVALLFFPPDAFGKRLLRSFLFGFFSSIPLAMWLGRNYILTGLFAGVRTPAYLTLAENLQLTGQTIANWFFPAPWNPIAALIFLALLAIAYTIHFLKQQQNFVQSSNQPLFVLLSTYTLAYTVYMNVMLSVYHNAQLGNRLLSPIFIPLLLALSYLFIRIKNGFSIVMSPSWQQNWLGLILLITLLISPMDAQYKLAQREVVTFSTGFSIYSLQNNETMAYLQKNPLPNGEMIYSNCHRCLYLFANIQPALPYDSKVRDMYLTPVNLPFYIVWFNEVLPEGGAFGKEYPMPDPSKLLGVPVKIKEYASFSDGTIYLVAP